MTTTESGTATAVSSAAPSLARDEVDVWFATLSVHEALLARLERTLSEEERERASRLRFDELRRRFVVAHGFLRSVLARYLQCAPEAVRIVPGPRGKPEVAADAARGIASLRFNLSHSEELAGCAVALHREVGIDVERVRDLSDVDGLARTVLTERERAQLSSWGRERAAEGFITAWTRKEAVLKARGEGLGRDPAAVEISLDPNGPPRLVAVTGDPGAERRWTVCAVEPVFGYLVAVAAEGADWRVRRRIWTGGDAA